QAMSYEEARNIAATLFDYNPDQPVIEQYFDLIAKLLRGDLGQSITSAGTSVLDQILRFLPWTLFSIGTALITSFTLGIVLGTAMAYWRGSVFDNVMTAIASI